MYTIKQTIQKILDKYSFNQKEAEQIMTGLLKGTDSPTQLAALLTAYRLKEEDLPEITGMAKIIRKNAFTIKPKVKKLVDIGGTGGSLITTFNISVLAAFVAAAAGANVAKQVDIAAPGSSCSAADVLKALGINLELEPKQVEKCIEKTGIGFLYAPVFHPKLLPLITVRNEIGIRTILNLLYRLAIPVNLTGMVLGVYKEKLTTIAAAALRNLGINKAMIVHGLEGLDEISISGITRISELKNGTINTFVLNPEDVGLHSASISSIIGSSCKENAQMARVILSGREHSPRTDVVILNAAAALYAGNVVRSLADGIVLAQKVLSSGQALKVLDKVIAFSTAHCKKTPKKNNRKSKRKK